MTPAAQLGLLIPLAYLLGSVPFGLLVALTRGIDPRKSGSGNIGATNVGRLLGGRFFAIVFMLDLLKALLPMLAGAYILHSIEQTPTLYLLWLGIGLAAVLGHMYSIFLGFKGGKGVATSTGFMLGLYPYYTLAAIGSILMFLVLFFAKRYVSLASMGAAAAFPISYLIVAIVAGWDPFTRQLPLLIVSVVVAAMVIFKHRTNIARLRAGTENRIGRKKAPTGAETPA